VSFQNIFASAEVWIAIGVYALLALVEPFLESALHRSFADNPAMQWSWDQFFAPLLRAIILVVFVYLAYPGLFGLRVAPSIVELLTNSEARLNTVIGTLFFAGFVASLIPGFGKHPEFVLPLQGCLGAGYFFFWLTTYLGVTTASLWPGLDVFLVMVLVSYVGHRIGGHLGRLIGTWFDGKRDTLGYDRVAVHVVELLAQIPVVALFGYGLGRQLAI
jgi:hypothetical protein